MPASTYLPYSLSLLPFINVFIVSIARGTQTYTGYSLIAMLNMRLSVRRM